MALLGITLAAVPLGFAWTADKECFLEALTSRPPWMLVSALVYAPSAILLWIWRAQHRDIDQQLTQNSQATDRLVAGVELLASKRTDIQAAGIHVLCRIAAVSEIDKIDVMETLATFVATHVTLAPGTRVRPPHRSRSVNLALDKLADLGGAPFGNYDLRNANFAAANLTNADLTRAQLDNADLTDAILFEAIMKGAILTEDTILEGTRFYKTLHDDTTRWPDSFDRRRLS